MTHSWSLASLKRTHKMRVAWNRHLARKTQSHLCISWSTSAVEVKIHTYTHAHTHWVIYPSSMCLSISETLTHPKPPVFEVRSWGYKHTVLHTYTRCVPRGVEGGSKGQQWKLPLRMGSTDRVLIISTIGPSVQRLAWGWATRCQT